METLAESLSDGIIAPLFYLAMGGVPLAMAYKAMNTLDSMIGHKDEKIFYFGRVAARRGRRGQFCSGAHFGAAALSCRGRGARNRWSSRD